MKDGEAGEEGKQSGTRQMIDLLKLSQKHGQEKLQEAIESALAKQLLRFRGDSALVERRLLLSSPSSARRCNSRFRFASERSFCLIPNARRNGSGALYSGDGPITMTGT